MKKLLSEVSGMTNHEYLKQQSAEWLADKLAEIVDCDCCPAAVVMDVLIKSMAQTMMSLLSVARLARCAIQTK